jgi:hypothetical protein
MEAPTSPPPHTHTPDTFSVVREEREGGRKEGRKEKKKRRGGRRK